MDIIITKEFQWSSNFQDTHSGVPDIQDAIKELGLIKDEFGSITPENILATAADKKSCFHGYFVWDNKAAAERYRLSQATFLLRNINVKVIKDGEPMFIKSFEIIKRTEFSKQSVTQYSKIDDRSFEQIEKIKNFIISDLNRIISKVSLFEGTEGVVTKLEEAMDQLLEFKIKPKKLADAV